MHKLSNVMVDVFVRHWLTIVVEEDVGLEGFYHALQRMASFFYADDGILTSMRTEWIHWEFNILVGLIGRGEAAETCEEGVMYCVSAMSYHWTTLGFCQH